MFRMIEYANHGPRARQPYSNTKLRSPMPQHNTKSFPFLASLPNTFTINSLLL